MREATRILGALTGSLFALASAGCAVATGPNPERFGAPQGPGLLRLGEVSTSFTGTWAASAPAATGFDANLSRAIHQGPAASLRSGDPAALALDIDLVVDHQDDLPRPTSLGLMSIVTVGVVPLYYKSICEAQCTSRIRAGEGREVGHYSVHETGTYKVLALPPTMFSLLAAGIRGDNDYKTIERKISDGLAAKLYTAISPDRALLAQAQQKNVPTLDVLGAGPSALLARGQLHLAAGRIEKARALAAESVAVLGDALSDFRSAGRALLRDPASREIDGLLQLESEVSDAQGLYAEVQALQESVRTGEIDFETSTQISDRLTGLATSLTDELELLAATHLEVAQRLLGRSVYWLKAGHGLARATRHTLDIMELHQSASQIDREFGDRARYLQRIKGLYEKQVDGFHAERRALETRLALHATPVAK